MNDSAAESAEALDPRVQIELERLNSATDEINRLEVELDEARLVFRRLLAEGHLRIQQLTKKLGTSIHKARPYYEARFRANITSQELHAANLVYDKANSAHTAAREMVFLAEQGLSRLAEGSDGGVTLDPAWQEMLNHATSRVNQAEAERASATLSLRTRSAAHRAAAALVVQLQGSLKRHITKSRPYFEEKARINAALEAQKARIQTSERQVGEAKQKYSSALRNLERISDEIHKHRSRRMSVRNSEAKTPQPLPLEVTDANIEEICQHTSDDNVREWLRRVDSRCDDNWTEIDLDYSSPDDVSFEKCSLRPLSPPSASPSSPTAPPLPISPPLPNSLASRASPRRIILSAKGEGDRERQRAASLKAELERGRRQSLDALLHDTGEKVKEMFQGFTLFGERRGSESAPRTPRRAPSPSPPSPRHPATSPRHPAASPRHPAAPASPATRGGSSAASDERYSDTDSLASMEMLTDDQIASLMLDAQLEAVCEKLAGVGLRETPHNGVRY